MVWPIKRQRVLVHVFHSAWKYWLTPIEVINCTFIKSFPVNYMNINQHKAPYLTNFPVLAVSQHTEHSLTLYIMHTVNIVSCTLCYRWQHRCGLLLSVLLYLSWTVWIKLLWACTEKPMCCCSDRCSKESTQSEESVFERGAETGKEWCWCGWPVGEVVEVLPPVVILAEFYSFYIFVDQQPLPWHSQCISVLDCSDIVTVISRKALRECRPPKYAVSFLSYFANP